MPQALPSTGIRLPERQHDTASEEDRFAAWAQCGRGTDDLIPARRCAVGIGDPLPAAVPLACTLWAQMKRNDTRVNVFRMYRSWPYPGTDPEGRRCVEIPSTAEAKTLVRPRYSAVVLATLPAAVDSSHGEACRGKPFLMDVRRICPFKVRHGGLTGERLRFARLDTPRLTAGLQLLRRQFPAKVYAGGPRFGGHGAERREHLGGRQTAVVHLTAAVSDGTGDELDE